MPGSFHGIHMASGALRAFQIGMDTTGHNLANVNTRGYSRQTVDYAANDPIRFWNGKMHTLGQGVSISSINRIRDVFLDGRMQAAQGDLGRFETLSQSLSQIEPVFNEPGPNGISSSLDRFFNAWSAAASNPGEPANRLEVQQAGQSLANRVRSTFGSLRTRQTQLDQEIRGVVGQVDRLTARIAQLNAEIRAETANGNQSSDLMDQRDIAIEDLSNLINVSTFPSSNGEINVSFGSLPLVDVAGSYAFPSNFDASTFTVNDGTQTFSVRSGTMFGLMEARNTISGYMAQLDTFADTLREQINGVHTTGLNPNGTTNHNFFIANTVDPQNGAIDFDLSAQIKADVNNIAFGVSGNEGDAGLALTISGLRATNVSSLGGKSFSTFYNELVSSVGHDANVASETLSTYESMVMQIEGQRQAVSGVSIDEEMANMLKLQRSYQAAARTLSMFDEMTQELIAMVR